MPEIVATLKTLMSMWISAYLVSNDAMVQVELGQIGQFISCSTATVKSLRLPSSSYGYICMDRLQRFEEGYEYGRPRPQTGRSVRQPGNARQDLFHVRACRISHWKNMLARATESFRRGYAFSVEGCDWTYALYGAVHIISNLIIAGVHCDLIAAEAQMYLEFLKDKATRGGDQLLSSWRGLWDR